MGKFNALDNEKKKRIINAAVAEFAEHGYEKASTNRIVKEAGIGKGMLFYYFNSKRELYEFLAGYALDFAQEKYLSRIDIDEPDFIERLKQAAEVKLEVQEDNKHIFNFLGTMMMNAEFKLPPHIQEKYEALQERGNTMMYENVDFSLFRDDIDVEKAFNLIRWSIEGYQNEILQQLKGQNIVSVDIDPYWKEFYGYLEVLKKSFYKEGKRER